MRILCASSGLQGNSAVNLVHVVLKDSQVSERAVLVGMVEHLLERRGIAPGVSGVVPPGLSERVRPEMPFDAGAFGGSRDDPVRLRPSDGARFAVVVALPGREERFVQRRVRVSDVPAQCGSCGGVERDASRLPSLLLPQLDPVLHDVALPGPLEDIADLEAQKIRDPQPRIRAYHEQGIIARFRAQFFLDFLQF